jgi:hypothetical protein
MEQLLLHLFGDFILQNDWMALNKKKQGYSGTIACLVHTLTYAIPFLLIGSWLAVIVIGLTHYIIDRGHLVEKFIRFKNNETYKDNFGFMKERPFAISIWLYIIIDNIFHLIINYLAIMFL